jgi:hypothetical protein
MQTSHGMREGDAGVDHFSEASVTEDDSEDSEVRKFRREERKNRALTKAAGYVSGAMNFHDEMDKLHGRQGYRGETKKQEASGFKFRQGAQGLGGYPASKVFGQPKFPNEDAVPLEILTGVKNYQPWAPRPVDEVCKTYGHIFRLLKDPHGRKGAAPQKNKLRVSVSMPRLAPIDPMELSMSSSHVTGDAASQMDLPKTKSTPDLLAGDSEATTMPGSMMLRPSVNSSVHEDFDDRAARLLPPLDGIDDGCVPDPVMADVAQCPPPVEAA